MVGNTGFRRALSVVVLISADAEWRVVRACYPDAAATPTPYGEMFTTALPDSPVAVSVIFQHGGWGKIAAAASTQHAIDRWRPDLLINLGTCGGFAGYVAPGEVILATRTVVYDIVEQMGDPAEAIAHFATELVPWWPEERDPFPVRRLPLVSADRDLVATEIPHLAGAYGAVAGDWESGAIAWVAARHGIPCLILRGVTDLVGTERGDAYDGNMLVFVDGADRVMRSLLAQLPAWIALATSRRQT